MVTEKDLNPELIEILSEQHKNIVIDFINSFLTTFKDCITREEVLTRINILKYIGFERQENIGERCGSADAKFISSYKKIIISSRHKTSENNIIKSLLYHELIHAISYHKEKDLDSCNNKYETYRTGLNREMVDFDEEYEGPGFIEGELLEEIMTEYYSTVLLKKEEIDFKGISILKNYCFDQDYVEYHGTGYYNVAALGNIYNFLFGRELLKAKLHDGNNFRKIFNKIFDETDIFDDMFTDEDFKVPCYSKFVAQRDIMGRYKIACKMFVEIFKRKNSGNIKSITDLLNNRDFNTFLNMLVKTRSKFDESNKINGELFLLIKTLEKNLVNELFGSKENENKYGIDNSDIETSLFLVIEKIYSENKNIDLNNIKYSVFYDNHFKGIYLIIGNEKYIIDYKTLSQDIDYAKMQKFSEYGFSKDEMDMYSKEYKMDIVNASFATIINPVSRMTFIEKNDKLYNYQGKEIIIDELKKYSTNITDSKLHSK